MQTCQIHTNNKRATPENGIVVPIRSSSSYHGTAHIPDNTGPVELLKAKKLLLIDDLENTTHSAKDLGFKFSYRKFAKLINSITDTCKMHSFFTCDNPEKNNRASYLEQRGWKPHPINIEYHGKKRFANSDNIILCYAGHLIGRSDADIIGIISGDGALANDIARFVSDLPKKRDVFTISLAGSTSYRLNAAKNRYITANIEIGLDCLRRMNGKKRMRRFRRRFY